jgi:hypothetical protein
MSGQQEVKIADEEQSQSLVANGTSPAVQMTNTRISYPLLPILITAGVTAAAAALIVAMVINSRQEDVCKEFGCSSIDGLWQDLTCDWFSYKVEDICCCSSQDVIDALTARLDELSQQQNHLMKIIPGATAAGVTAIGTAITAAIWGCDKNTGHTNQSFLSFLFKAKQLRTIDPEAQHIQRTSQDYGATVQG